MKTIKGQRLFLAQFAQGTPLHHTLQGLTGRVFDDFVAINADAATNCARLGIKG